MKSNYLIIFCFLLSFQTFGQFKFSKKEVLEDLDYLYESLIDAHYNIYAYTSEQEFESTYQKIQNSITQDSLILLETINLFQRLTSAVNNGHTSIDFPVAPYFDYVESGGTVFPLEVAIEEDKSLVRKNWSNNSNIAIGSEILSINGMPMSKVLSKIYPQISAERLYFKNVKLELFTLPRYYRQIFGQVDNFEVEILSNGEVQKYSLQAIPAMEGYEMKTEFLVNAQMKLEFFENAAYLNPGGFGGDKQKYQSFIDSAFVEINANQVENLIIDLRNNPGGNDAFSDYMVAYFADKPFKWNSSFTLKTSKFLKEYTRKNFDTTEVYWQKVLSYEDGEVYDHKFEEYQAQAEEKRFKGKVYVLINRQSHSQSAVTAAQIQDYSFGTLVGEETGDYPSLYASIFDYPLPNTGITVHVSKGYMVRVNGSTKEEGVIPDIFIKDYLLDENDEVLEGLLKMIE